MYLRLRFLRTHLSALISVFLIVFSTRLFAQEELQAQIVGEKGYSLSNRDSSTNIQPVSILLQQASDLRYKNTDSAILLAQKALIESRLAGDVNGIARSLLCLGAYWFDKRDYHKSRLFFYEAIPYCRSTFSENKAILAELYNDLANICIVQGKTDSAISYYFKSIAAIREGNTLNMRLLASVYANLGATLIYSEQADQGIFYLKKSFPLALLFKDNIILAQNYFNFGFAYGLKHRTDSAIHYWEIANKYNRILGRKMEIGKTYAYMGTTLGAQGDLIKAKSYFDSSLLAEPKSAAWNGDLQNGLGDFYFAKGEYRKAIGYYKRVLEILNNMGVKNSRTSTYYCLSACYYKIGNKDAALSYMKAYTDLRDSLLDEEKIKTVNTLEVKYRIAEKDKEITVKQLQLARNEIELKNKNILIICVAGGILLSTISFLSWYRRNRNKQKLQSEQFRYLQQEQNIYMLHAQMEGVELERKRLAQELHDGIGGMLAAVKMNFSTLEYRHPILQQDRGYRETFQLLTHTASELRQTAHNLMPAILMQEGLEAALRQYCHAINTGQKEVKLEFQAYGLEESLNDDLKRAVFLLVQELVQNILKHAAATQALVQLSIQQNLLHVLVEDNGKGLQLQNTEDKTGLGLSTLQERIHLLGGHCTIDSAPGKGTAIDLEFELGTKGKNKV